MIRREYVKATGAAVIGSVVAGCTASDAGSSTGGEEKTTEPDDGTDDGGVTESRTGRLATSVTDQPVDIDDFESCVVTIEGIWVKPDSKEGSEDGSSDGTEPGPESSATGSEDDRGNDEEPSTSDEDQERSEATAGNEGDGEGRRYVEFDEPQEADLVRLQGANTQLIDETELPVGGYRYLQLDVGDVRGELKGGGEAEIDTPGEAPLQFKRRFEIRADERTRFVADFAPVRRGQGARYLLRPVARGTQVLYGDETYDPDRSAGDGEDDDGADGGGEGEGAGEDEGGSVGADAEADVAAEGAAESDA